MPIPDSPEVAAVQPGLEAPIHPSMLAIPGFARDDQVTACIDWDSGSHAISGTTRAADAATGCYSWSTNPALVWKVTLWLVAKTERPAKVTRARGKSAQVSKVIELPAVLRADGDWRIHTGLLDRCSHALTGSRRSGGATLMAARSKLGWAPASGARPSGAADS